MTDKLVAVFAEELDVGEELLNDNSSTDNVDEWDSLAAMRLVVALESEFKIRLSAAEIVSMKSIGIARQVLRQKGVPL